MLTTKHFYYQFYAELKKFNSQPNECAGYDKTFSNFFHLPYLFHIYRRGVSGAVERQQNTTTVVEMQEEQQRNRIRMWKVAINVKICFLQNEKFFFIHPPSSYFF